MALNKKAISDNFNSQYDYHIHSILRSGLMLDEDMNCVLNHFSGESNHKPCVKLSLFQKLMSGVSITSSILIFLRKLPVLYVPASLTPALFIGFRCLYKIFYWRTQRRNVEILIKTMDKISRLNRNICEYFKMRNTSSATALIINPYTRNLQELIHVIFKEEVCFLHGLKILIRHILTFVPSLKSDYSYVEEVDLDQFNALNVRSIDDCIIYMKKLCDIYILLSSNALTCMCIALCPIIWTEFEFDVNTVVDLVVPNMKKMSLVCFEIVNTKFNNVKFFYLNGVKLKFDFTPTRDDHSRKLYEATSTMLIRMAHIVEKSHLIVKKLETNDYQSIIEKENLSKCIVELRGDVLNYYQSLEILSKIYELDLNDSRPPMFFTKDSSTENSVESSASIVTIDASQNTCDPEDDEEYECYVGANDVPGDTLSVKSYEEETQNKYSAVLLHELKEKLKSHSQFVAARKKRGIVEDDSENDNQPCCSKMLDNKPPPDLLTCDEPNMLKVPYFLPKPLSPLRVPNPLPNCEDFNQIRLPPPPPPPLAPIDFGPYGEMVRSPYTVDDFFQSVRIAVRRRGGIIEETFEDGSTTDDD